jgi:hypothetical protein
MVGKDRSGRTRLNYPQDEWVINIIGSRIEATEDASLGKEKASWNGRDEIYDTCSGAALRKRTLEASMMSRESWPMA